MVLGFSCPLRPTNLAAPSPESKNSLITDKHVWVLYIYLHALRTRKNIEQDLSIMDKN